MDEKATQLPEKLETEKSIPFVWRPVLTQIVARLVVGDYNLIERPINVNAIDHDLAEMIAHQIKSYGDPMTELTEASWERSVYLWMGEKWEVLVDLCTESLGVSDLVMFLNVFEDNDGFIFQISSVHVP